MEMVVWIRLKMKHISYFLTLIIFFSLLATIQANDSIPRIAKSSDTLSLHLNHSNKEFDRIGNDIKRVEQKVDVIEPDDLKKIVDLVNGILMSKTKDELIEVGNIIKTTKESYNDTQTAYLRELYKKANSRYTETF